MISYFSNRLYPSLKLSIEGIKKLNFLFNLKFFLFSAEETQKPQMI